MQKEQIVESLKEMADLLEILEASRFEYSAFRNAAGALDDWSGDLTKAVETDAVTEIPTIGKGTAKVICELAVNGESEDLNAVRAQVPEELPHLLRFRGLGPKRVRALWKELGIESPADLERAIADESIKSLKGFGAKTVDSLQSSVEYFKNNKRPNPQPGGKIETPAKIVIPRSVESSGKLFPGTSGYSYPKWKGSFYPAKAKTAELLTHYSELLPSVEINNTFYRFPSEKVVEQWKSQTPGDFQFALKANRRITHQMRLNQNSKKNIREFVERCSVLGQRLGCILFQLPPDFERDDDRLNNLLSAVPAGPRYAIEFRHKSWNHDEIYQQLKSKNVALVCGDSEKDGPKISITADFVYARLRKTAYTGKELDEWGRCFAEQQERGRDVLFYLKHDDTGDAPNSVKARWHSQ